MKVRKDSCELWPELTTAEVPLSCGWRQCCTVKALPLPGKPRPPAFSASWLGNGAHGCPLLVAAEFGEAQQGCCSLGSCGQVFCLQGFHEPTLPAHGCSGQPGRQVWLFPPGTFLETSRSPCFHLLDGASQRGNERLGWNVWFLTSFSGPRPAARLQ